MSLSHEDRSTALPEDRQNASLAGTYAAPPGVQVSVPAGVTSTSSEYSSTAPSVDSTPVTATSDKSPSTSVQNSFDPSTGQTPSTQSITEQLPSAQGAANAIKAGASSLLAGIGNLAIGVNDAASHPDSGKAQNVDKLHIPGAFEDETSDREDIVAVQRDVQSATEALPSTQAIKRSIPGGGPSSDTTKNTSGFLAEQAETLARSVQDQTRPGVDYVKEQLPVQQARTENEQIHKDGTDYIKSQVHNNSNNSVSSAAKTSTINQLASQVLWEMQAIPDVVKDSQRQAGGAAPLNEPAFSTLEASSTTAQLAGRVQLEPKGVPTIVADSHHQAGISPEAAANPQAVQDKRHLEKEIKQEIPMANITSAGAAGTTNQLAEQVSREPRGVPQIVADSQKRADVSPEASANAEAVREKKQVEQELRREVPQTTSKDNMPVNLGEAISGGITAAGAAIASAAASARQTTLEATRTDPVAVLPISAQKAIDGDARPSTVGSASRPGAVPEVVQASQQQVGVPAEASADPEAVREKSQFERELQQEVHKQGESSISESLGESVAAGLAAAGAAVAGAATYAREKTAETTGTDPVSVLPVSTQQVIDGDRFSDSPAHVPNVVSVSQRTAGAGTEAAANPMAVQDKNEVERELRREILPAPATSGSQSITGAISGGAAAAGSAAADAAILARRRITKVTGTDPVSVLPETAQSSIARTSGTNSGSASQSAHDRIGCPSSLGQITHENHSSDPKTSSTFPLVVDEPGRGHNSARDSVDLHSGVHNGVVGDHLDDTQSVFAKRVSSHEVDAGSFAPVAHIGSVRNVDLSAGVKNTVVGSGAEHHGDPNPQDPSSGL